MNSKICSKCKLDKELSSFYYRKDKNTYDSICRECLAKYKREYYQKNKDRLREIDNIYRSDPERREKKNKKQREYYQKNKKKISEQNKIKRGGENKELYNENQKLYRQNNPEKVTNYRLKSNYNITLYEYNEIFNNQDGRCLICNIELVHRLDNLKSYPSESILSGVIDHDHETGKIRGILCNKCNMGIGLLKHDTSILLSAVKYLEIYGT